MTEERDDALTEAARSALQGRVASRLQASSELVLPAAPALLEHYTNMLLAIFAALGSPFNAADTDRLREHLRHKLEEAFRISQYANVVVRYSSARFEQGIRYE